MKTSMERVYPIAKDMAEQIEANPSRNYVFFYDDGVFRAFLVDGVEAGEHSVTAWRHPESPDDERDPIVTIPSTTAWRLVHKSCLEFVNGAMLEQLELIGSKQKLDLREKMLKKLGLDKEGKKKKRDDAAVDVSQIPFKTGQFI